MDDVLKKVYTDPRHPGSYSGAAKLKKSIGQQYHVSIKKIKQWLKSNDTYTKHRTARKNFKRNQIIAPHIDAQWQGDLADLGNIVTYNDGMRYILIMIDVVSKYAWAEPLQKKDAKSVKNALEKMFARTTRRPEKIQTDDGKEFLNSQVQEYLREHGIKFFTLKSDKKAAIVERLIRTIKERLFRYMHEKNTRRYIDVLQDVVSSYNDTYHKSIKMSPAAVNEKTEGQVLRTLYGQEWMSADGDKLPTINKLPRHQLGDLVRLSRLKGVFNKGYIGNWTEEIFVIAKIIHSKPYTLYRVKDWNQEELKGSFYEHELQEVDKDLQGFWKIEKIIETKRRGRKLHYFVKWLGYPDSMNSWVTDIKSLGN
jgi:transposase InsO family protein